MFVIMFISEVIYPVIIMLKIFMFLFTQLTFNISQGLQPTKRDAFGRLILGDIITSVNGKKVTNGSDLYRILDQCKVGDQV